MRNIARAARDGIVENAADLPIGAIERIKRRVEFRARFTMFACKTLIFMPSAAIRSMARLCFAGADRPTRAMWRAPLAASHPASFSPARPIRRQRCAILRFNDVVVRWIWLDALEWLRKLLAPWGNAIRWSARIGFGPVSTAWLVDYTIADEMEEVAVNGLHRIEVKDDDREPGEAILEIIRRLATWSCGADYHG